MSRYRVSGEWGAETRRRDFFLQSADLLDTQTNTVYRDGAYRVVDARDGMKPAKRGKGGTVPFKGEFAWADGQRLMNDLYFEREMGR